MIKIEIDARSMGKRGSGFAVRSEFGHYKWLRTILCGKVTTNRAELMAFDYAFKSIISEFEDEPVKVRTTGRYVAMMLEIDQGIWAKQAKFNVELVGSVREQYSRFGNISVETSSELEVREINENSIRGKFEVFEK
jgi:ribonuclease HI